VDNLIEANGGLRLADRGVSDASQGDISGDFEKWTNKKLWPMLLSNHHTGQSLERMKPKMPKVELSISYEQRAENLQAKVEWAEVTYVKSLTQPGESEKRHIEFKLPESFTYQAGDYLAVLPLNPDVTVRRVMRRFNLPDDGVIKINEKGSTVLPTDQPISISDLLAGYVELSQPATQRVSSPLSHNLM
jgi:cytochrome P450/NADPH-cytochrome P450 reductase